MLNDKTILITGGTGSLGKALTRIIYEKYPSLKKIIIFSRDEQKQFIMSQEFSFINQSQIRFFIGDVRDLSRLERAFLGVDYVIHCAAMKHVPIAEYNPDECIKTNVIGAQNVITAAIKSNVKSVVSLSTDKASSPINLYGATKLTSDKLFIAANNIKGDNPISFSVVRYGNVMGSNGSVIPFFLKLKDKDIIPITHPNMTRFNITIEEGVELILFALKNAKGGELFVPKIPSYDILVLAKAIAPKATHKIIGIRPGEKIHEEMISRDDALNTVDIDDYYIILPNGNEKIKSFWVDKFNAKQVDKNFEYNSLDNTNRETLKSLKSKIELLQKKYQ